MIKISNELYEEYRTLAQHYLDYGMDSHAADCLNKIENIKKARSGELC